MKMFGTMKRNSSGNLEIGGCDTVDLVKEFGTPLYIMDETLIRKNCKEFKESFKIDGINTEIIYASKAFLNMAICKIMQQEGMSLDVVSGGELYTALKAGFPAEKIYMHGNNKTIEELELAVKSSIGRIIVDNLQELMLLEDICSELGKGVNVQLRVNPGIEAHTHQYIQTSKNDSKFGISIFREDICEIIGSFGKSKWITLKGFHCHIGSQIFDKESFYNAVLVMLEFISRIKFECSFITEELNLGGGFGVYYSNGDEPVDIRECLTNILFILKENAERLGLELPRVMLEPGRAIVANAGTTLYSVGGIKKTYGGKNYVFVDGGMTDNPRTAIYDAKYEAVVANKINNEDSVTYTIAGKCCESGDIIIKEIDLPVMERGDILAVLSTGAYNYSMSSNYNRIPKPAVVFVKDKQARLTVKRETYEDIIKNDIQF